MLYSMTGFNRVRKEYEWGILTLEISSVNSRYLELNIRADRELSGYEPFIQNTVRGRLSRGKVLLRAEVKWAAALIRDRLNTEVPRDYYQDLLRLQGEVGGPVPALTDLLTLPGVSESSPLRERSHDDLQKALSELLDQALTGLTEMRAAEGKNLAKDITANLDAYDELIAKIAAQWQEISQQVFSDYREKISKNIEQLGFSADPARLAQELVILADKWDIAEELTRSSSHTAQFRKLLDQGGTVGRKLDFLVQEMNREINTMGSKSASTDLRWLVVDGKTLLERIREQIQNVE